MLHVYTMTLCTCIHNTYSMYYIIHVTCMYMHMHNVMNISYFTLHACTCIHNTRHLYTMYCIIHVTCMYNDIMYMYT